MTPKTARRTRRLWLPGLLGSLSLTWLFYKVRNTRILRRPMLANHDWQTDPNAVADMSQLTPGAAPIRCQPWDIGTGVTGYVWHAPDPRAVLLLQHGLGEYAQRYVTRYDRLTPHFLNARISVYAFDLWGHGRSPGGCAVTDVGQAIQDHLTARRRLREQPLPVFVMGHSLGGLVTASSVARDGNGLSGAIISSAALQSDASAPMRACLSVAAAFAPTLPTIALDQAGMTRIAEERQAAASDPLLYQGRVPLLLLATSVTTAHDNWTRYPTWHAPTLVLHGTADTATDPAGSRRFFETIASPDKTLHIVEGGYHELLNDTERDETLRVLLTWLERRLPPT